MGNKKRPIKLFISYAHKNKQLVSDFRSRFDDHLHASINFDYQIWQDIEIKAGEVWEEGLLTSLKQCDLGILLVSPAFLVSNYIIDKELPLLLNHGKIIIPVALYPIDFKHYDLHGLASRQFFLLNKASFDQPRSYAELKNRRRDDFTLELFKEIEEVLIDKGLLIS